MKQLISILALMLACVAGAAEANLTKDRSSSRDDCMRTWTPFALTIAGPVGLPWGSWDILGLQVGVWNDVYEMKGLQIGIFNVADRMSGLQIGGINVADKAYGLQIGFLNVISGDDCPFLPVLNWSF